MTRAPAGIACLPPACWRVCVPPSRAATGTLSTGLNASPPGGSRYRPDLEATLASLVSAYRVEEGKEPITPDDTFQAAARAHAADMMLNGFMGHSSSTGLSFQGRMQALVGDVTKFPSIGENAARDT
jgi:uncharacterized protein YkwD